MANRLLLLPLNAEVSRKGHLIIGGCDTVELAAEYGTPLYVYDEFTLRRNCQEFRSQFAKCHPDTTVLYASKAGLNRALANIFKEEGLGLDVVSAGELFIAGSVDFPMDMIYMHGNNKSVEELKAALKHHLGRIVVDNLGELELLGKLAEESGHIPDILLRITPGVDPHTHGHITTGMTGSKFGFPMFAADEAVTRAMSAAGLDFIGLHCHIGSQITDIQPYRDAIDIILDFAASMRDKHGFEMEELNIGGGFAVQYTSDDKIPPVSAYAEAIVSQLVQKCQKLDLPLPMLTIEPGRAIAASAGVALYQVGTTKEIPGLLRYVAVDGGMADNIRPALYDAKYEAVAAGKMMADNSQKVTIAGRFCESGDILVRDIDMPPLAAGDILAIPACGAYCLPMASNYNASLKPAVVMVKEGKARLIRKRDTLDDLIAADSL